MTRFITGLDVGTASVKTAAAEITKEGKVKIFSLFKQASSGIRKGVVAYTDDAEKSVMSSLERVKGAAKHCLKNIYMNVGGDQNKVQVSRGMVAVSRADNEISKDDIDRVIKSSQDAVSSSNRVIIHTLTKDFIVDGMPKVDDPAGLVGNRLEVESIIISSFTQNVRSLNKLVEKSAGVIGGMVLGPIASARAVLSKNQKDLGVALVEIGAGTTGISIFEEGKLLHAAILPIGSANITNDLAIGLKIPIEAAEALKLSYGYALSRDIPVKEKIELKKVDAGNRGGISRKFFSEIIEVRLAEIFELVNNELKSAGKEKDLPAGVVFSGGGSKMPGITELGKRELKLPVQVGMVLLEQFEFTNKEIEEKAEDPEFASVLGLALFGCDEVLKGKIRFFNPFSRILDYFLP